MQNFAGHNLQTGITDQELVTVSQDAVDLVLQPVEFNVVLKIARGSRVLLVLHMSTLSL